MKSLAQHVTLVTVNCLHPATYMPTKMVLEAGVNLVSSLEQGLPATLRLVADADLDEVTGRYFDGRREARALPQAYDLDARHRLRELSTQLVGLPAEAIATPRLLFHWTGPRPVSSDEMAPVGVADTDGRTRWITATHKPN